MVSPPLVAVDSLGPVVADTPYTPLQSDVAKVQALRPHTPELQAEGERDTLRKPRLGNRRGFATVLMDKVMERCLLLGVGSSMSSF